MSPFVPEPDPVLILLFIAIQVSLRESLFLDVLFTGIVQFYQPGNSYSPPGFESLLEGQTEQIEVLLPGHSLGLFPVVVKPDTVQFMSPLMVLESSGLAALPVAERQKALAALSRPLLRNSNLVCGVSEAKDSSECGYVATDKEDVAVIFDENNGQLSLFLNRD